jgi:hypothetical protein
MGKYSSKAQMLQGQITNQWSYYQSKSLKLHTFDLQKRNLELSLSCQKGRIAKPIEEDFVKTIAQYDGEVKRYDREKDEIKADADKMEKEKLVAQKRGANFSYSLIFLQIAIMLSSVAMITKKKYLWYVGLAIMSGGVFFTLAGIYLFY